MENALRRQLNPLHVWAIAFGCIIGWGSFINPGKKFLPASGVAGTAIAMAMGMLVMIVISFSYAYMVPKYPKAGGEFTFTKMCFGPKSAYLCGWFLVAAYLTNVPMNSTAMRRFGDGTFRLGLLARLGGFFSATFMVLQLVPRESPLLARVLSHVACRDRPGGGLLPHPDLTYGNSRTQGVLS